MQYKQFHDFATASGAEHPGQPVHSDLHFDVWASLSGSRPPLYYLIDQEGRRIEFCSPEEAIAHGRQGAPAIANDSPSNVLSDGDHQRIRDQLGVSYFFDPQNSGDRDDYCGAIAAAKERGIYRDGMSNLACITAMQRAGCWGS